MGKFSLDAYRKQWPRRPMVVGRHFPKPRAVFRGGVGRHGEQPVNEGSER
jgi:hypothetical protein